MKWILAIGSIIVINSCACYAHGSTPFFMINGTKTVYFDFGFDYGMTTTIGYAQQVATLRGLPFLLGGDFSFPSGTPLFDDSRFQTPIAYKLFAYKNAGVFAQCSPSLYLSKNSLFSSRSIATTVSLEPGYFKSNWQISADIAYEHVFLTYLENSDSYRRDYPEAKDGWYSSTAGTFRFGLSAGVTIRHFVFNLAGGISMDRLGNSILIPYYALIGVGYSFCK
jgi:hypothetical protein